MNRLLLITILLCAANSSFSQEPEIIEIESPKIHKNLLTVDYVSPVFGAATLSYERLFASGKLGLEVPVSIGFKSTSNIASEPRTWAAGLEIKYYPTGQSKVAYYLGLDNQVGQLKEYYYYYDYFAPYPPYPQEANHRMFFATYVKNGVAINVFERLSIAPAFALGVRSFNSSYGIQTDIHAYGEFAMSFKF